MVLLNIAKSSLMNQECTSMSNIQPNLQEWRKRQMKSMTRQWNRTALNIRSCGLKQQNGDIQSDVAIKGVVCEDGDCKKAKKFCQLLRGHRIIVFVSDLGPRCGNFNSPIYGMEWHEMEQCRQMQPCKIDKQKLSARELSQHRPSTMQNITSQPMIQALQFQHSEYPDVHPAIVDDSHDQWSCAYRAPEIFSGNPRASLSSDIFSLALVISGLFSNGRHPFGISKSRRMRHEVFPKGMKVDGFSYYESRMVTSNWCENAHRRYHMPLEKLHSLRREVGVVSNRQKIETLKLWLKKHKENDVWTMIEIAEVFSGKGISQNVLKQIHSEKVLKEIIRMIPNKNWLRFVRTELGLNRHEMNELHEQYAAFTMDQKFQIIKHWFIYSRLPCIKSDMQGQTTNRQQKDACRMALPFTKRL